MSSSAVYRVLVPASTALTSLRSVAVGVARKFVTGTIGTSSIGAVDDGVAGTGDAAGAAGSVGADDGPALGSPAVAGAGVPTGRGVGPPATDVGTGEPAGAPQPDPTCAPTTATNRATTTSPSAIGTGCRFTGRSLTEDVGIGRRTTVEQRNAPSGRADGA